MGGLGGGVRPWLRTSRGWETPLGQWMSEFGVPNLRAAFAKDGLPVSAATPYHWLEGRHPPSDFYAQEMIRLSQGRLTYEDIYGHRALLGKFPVPKGLEPRHEL